MLLQPVALNAKMINYLGTADSAVVTELLHNTFYASIGGRECDPIPFWDRMDNPSHLNPVLNQLIKNGSIAVNYRNNFIGIEQIFDSDITDKVMDILIHHYLMPTKASDRADLAVLHICDAHGNKVRTKMPNGITRNGFLAAAKKSRFTYDTALIAQYRNEIIDNIYRSHVENIDDVKWSMYDGLLERAIDTYINQPEAEYCLGKPYFDSRGRSIFSCTGAVFNPVQHKYARSLMRIPTYTLTETGRTAILQFIPELLNIRSECNTLDDLTSKGMEAYKNRTLPAVLSYETLWLQRLYDTLDNGYGDVPVEMDCLASAVQMYGLLLGSRELLTETNVIFTGTLHDVWTHEGTVRSHIKAAITPHLYGSEAPVRQLLQHNKIVLGEELSSKVYTLDEIKRIQQIMDSPLFAEIMRFKNHLISANLERIHDAHNRLHLHVGKEEYFTTSTKYRYDKVVARKYDLITNDGMKTIVREYNPAPDWERMKRYLPTGLIHNLDSQVANTICESFVNSGMFIIPNHDAFLIDPNNSDHLRDTIRDEFREIYSNRKDIIAGYCKSIGLKPFISHCDSSNLLEEISGYGLK